MICRYSPDWGGLDNISRQISEDGKATIRKVFTITGERIKLTEADLYDYSAELESSNILNLMSLNKVETIEFIIGSLENGYYLLDNRIMGFENNFFLHQDLKITHKTFLAHLDINILLRIDKMSNSSVYIGDSAVDNVSTSEFIIPTISFEQLLKSFPTTSEMKKYSDYRVSQILGDFMDVKRDYVYAYDAYMNKKVNHAVANNESEKQIENNIYENEYQKYLFIFQKLTNMLENEDSYSEKDWQKEIFKILTLIYPKYSTVVDEITIKTDEGNKRLDFILIDVQGNIDVVEIKKSHQLSPLAKSKKEATRNNYIPSRQLISTVMQIEKYIYHLNRSGKKSEDVIKKKLQEKQILAISPKIRNPQGLIIMGRSHEMTDEEKSDYEVIKRQYKHISDILTYDDLLNRLKILLEHFGKIIRISYK